MNVCTTLSDQTLALSFFLNGELPQISVFIMWTSTPELFYSTFKAIIFKRYHPASVLEQWYKLETGRMNNF